MSLWDEVVKTALLGTERQQLPRPQGDTPLAQLLRQIDRTNSEEALLNTIAALSLHQTIGRQTAPTAPTPISPAPAASQPLCSEAAAKMLSRLLSSHHRELLPEFLSLLAEVNQRVPEQLLPVLIHHGRRVAKHRPLIPAVIGERGRWLASHNPQWRYAALNLRVPEQITAAWPDYNKQEKHAIFQLLRHHHPHLARQLLEQRWAHEAQPDRLHFIRLLETHLSPADEPFLEEIALDDRAHQIRRKAAELLSRLPDSRLCQRMAERTRPHLQWFWLSRQLATTLPQEITDEMIRDGIKQRTTRSGMGQQSWRLTQMLAATPLHTWTDAFNTPIDNLLNGLRKNKWRRAILRGWTQAAERQQNAAWALALLRHSNLSTTSNRARAKLVTALPPVEREQFALETAQQFTHEPELHRYHPLILVLERCAHQWSATLTETFITHLLTHIRSDPHPRLDQLFIKTLRSFARYISPDAAEQFKTLLPHTAQSPPWRRVITEIISTLTFRQDMYTEIMKDEL